MRRPLYQELADHLVVQITNGSLRVGERVPTEFELCAEHEMSRGTVRQALHRLEVLGMIERSRAGTTVTATQPVDTYRPSAATPEEVMERVRSTQLWHPAVAEVVADAAIAARLDVDEGSYWYLLAGPLVMRSDPATVLCWSEHYHLDISGRDRLRRGDFDVSDLESTTLEQVVTAEPLREDLASALGAAPGSPSLVVRRTHFAAGPVKVKVSVHTHRGDRHRITTTFEGVHPKI